MGYLDNTGLTTLWSKIKALVPSKTSELTNDSGFISNTGVYGIYYGTCTTAGGTAAKVASLDNSNGFSLTKGVTVAIKFSNANTVASPTLAVAGTTAKSIKRYGTTAPSTSAATSWNAGSVVVLVYDGSYWQMVGWLNSTYSEISEANITSASGSSTGLVSGRRAKAAVTAFAPVTDVTVGGTSVMSGTTAVIPALPTGIDPYITNHGTYGSFWTYRVWSNNFQEVWFHGSIKFTSASSQVNGWHRAVQNVTIPISNMTGVTAFSDDCSIFVSGSYAGRVFTCGGIKTNGTVFEAQQLGGASMATTTVAGWNVYIAGFKRT